MRFAKQLFRHRPDDGVYGDCFRTVIACILELDPAEVPHEHRKMADGEFTAFYDDWLHKRGIRMLRVAISTEDIAHALSCAKSFSDGLPYIFSGTSRTGVNHAVIGRDDAIIHDPSLTDAGIVGPCDDGMFHIEWLVLSAEGRKPDWASAGQAAPPEGQPPAGGEAAREASL